METIVYSKHNCPACDTLKAQYKQEGREFVEMIIGEDITVTAFREQFPNVRTVPYVVNKE